MGNESSKARYPSVHLLIDCVSRQLVDDDISHFPREIIALCVSYHGAQLFDMASLPLISLQYGICPSMGPKTASFVSYKNGRGLTACTDGRFRVIGKVSKYMT